MLRIYNNLRANLIFLNSFNNLKQDKFEFGNIFILSQKRKKHYSHGVNHHKLAILKDILTDDNIKTHEIEWKLIRDDLIKNEKHISAVNIDAVILGSCNSSNHLNIAKSYVKFLRNEGLEINYASIGRLMKVYYLAYKSGKLSNEDEQEILTLYDKIKAKCEVINATTCEYLIFGLVACNKLEDSMELLNMIKITSKPSTIAYCTVISKAFENIDTFPDGWKVLKDMISNGKLPKCEVFIEYVKSIKRDKSTFIEKLELMLQFIGDNNILVSSAVIKNLQEALTELSYNSFITNLSTKGKCGNCGSYMQNVSTTEEEFRRLSSTFLEKVLIRRDVFQRSSPEEVDMFINFVNKHGPFGCVVDGLNVAFSSGTNKSSSVYAKYISSVVQHLSTRHKRILVIGRNHMKRWPMKQVNLIRKNAVIFFADNLTHDDPFLLYAALKSGPKTDFVSRDLMRSHAYLLGDELKDIFKRWQQEHQYLLVTVTNDGEAIFREPIKYNLCAHKVGNTWHIPFQEEYSATPGDFLAIPNSWLCISK